MCMTGKIIDGLAVALDVSSRVKQAVGELKKRRDVIPCLATYSLETYPASSYIRKK